MEKQKKDFNVKLADGFSFTDKLNARHWVAYNTFVEHSPLLIVSRVDRSEKKELSQDRNIIGRLTWSPDGKIIYCGHPQIYALYVSTAKIRAVTDFQGYAKSGIGWHLYCSDDGKHLLFYQSENILSDGTVSYPPVPRFCMIGTDGAGFRVIFENDKGTNFPGSADVHWKNGLFVVVISQIRKTPEIWLMDIDGQNKRLLSRLPTTSISFMPDGKHIVLLGLHDELQRVSVVDGTVESLHQRALSFSVSPDGKHIAFMQGDYELSILDLNDNSAQTIASAEGENLPYGKARRQHFPTNPVWSADGRLLWFSIVKAWKLSETKPLNPSINTPLPQKGAVSSEDKDSKMLEAIFKQMDEAERYWDYSHKYGIVDFKESKIWLTDEYCRDISFPPVGDKDIF